MKKPAKKKTARSNAPRSTKKPKEVWIMGVTRMARAIAAEFKTTCSKQDIHFWQGQKPPFPGARDNGQYNQAECFEFFKTHVLPKRATPGLTEDIFMRAAKASAEQEIRDNEESKFKFDQLQGKYIERTMAERTIVGALKKYHGFVRRELEREATQQRKQKLEALGVAPELIVVFCEFDAGLARAMVDRIEKQVLAHGKAA